MRWAAICALALLPGCSLGGDEEPVPAGRATREIGALVRQLDSAAQRGDAAALCEDVLTKAARARMGGPECSRRVRRGLSGLREPRVGLLGIRLTGRGVRAVARVRTTVLGRRPLDERLELRRLDGEWRVEARR